MSWSSWRVRQHYDPKKEVNRQAEQKRWHQWTTCHNSCRICLWESRGRCSRECPILYSWGRSRLVKSCSSQSRLALLFVSFSWIRCFQVWDPGEPLPCRANVSMLASFVSWVNELYLHRKCPLAQALSRVRPLGNTPWRGARTYDRDMPRRRCKCEDGQQLEGYPTRPQAGSGQPQLFYAK